jgi:DNA-binding winged helix-turn-helix (wHTH) protein
MMPASPLVYEFAGFRLDVLGRRLLRNGEVLPIAPKPFDTLLLLVENRGRVLEKDELMKMLWPESFVEEANLAQNIFVLRKLLGDSSGHTLIQTIPRRGYKFVAKVKEIAGHESVAMAKLQFSGAYTAVGDMWWSWTGTRSAPSGASSRPGANIAKKKKQAT